MLHIKFGFDWPSGFREENLCKVWTTGLEVDGQTTEGRLTDDGWTPDACLSYKLTCEPLAQVN